MGTTKEMELEPAKKKRGRPKKTNKRKPGQSARVSGKGGRGKRSGVSQASRGLGVSRQATAPRSKRAQPRLLRDLWRNKGLQNERIYLDWHAFRENVMREGGLTEAKAESSATAMESARSGLTRRQIRNIIDKGDALLNDIRAKGLTASAKQNAHREARRAMTKAIEDAVKVLEKPFYKDLLEQCATSQLTGTTRGGHVVRTTLVPAMAAFFPSNEKTTSPDSLQRLAATLAIAFLRAHEVADKEVAGYAERKRK